MIGAKELRIGNLIQLKSGRISRVLEITNFYLITSLIENNPNFSRVGDKFAISSDWIKPISLTSEILEKCGFIIESNPNNTNSLLCYTPTQTIVLILSSNCVKLRHYSGIHKSIFYLHQLQNIYYALTGEELEYTP